MDKGMLQTCLNTNELGNDLITSWNEVNEALESLKTLFIDEIEECLPSIIQRLEDTQHWLGKYVSEDDILQLLN